MLCILCWRQGIRRSELDAKHQTLGLAIDIERGGTGPEVVNMGIPFCCCAGPI